MVKCLEKLKPASFTFDGSLKKEIGSLSPDKTLLVQLSDLHINELTNEADYHAHTKTEIKILIDKDIVKSLKP